jgi:hypothetical protein
MLYITHKPGHCIMMFEMHMWKLMAAQSKCDIVSCHTFPWINFELFICTSDPWWKLP